MRKRSGGRACTNTPLNVEDIVLVSVDKVDRGKCDPRRIPGVVVNATAHEKYHIACKGGCLKSCLSRGDLVVEASKTADSYGLGDLLRVDWTTLKKISIREAAANYSPVGGQGMVHCTCKTDCAGNRCACKKAGYVCNSRCHKSNVLCKNCDPDVEA